MLADLISQAWIWEISFGDIFGDFFGGGRRNSNNNGPAQGASVRLTVRITFEEAVFDVLRNLSSRIKKNVRPVMEPGQNQELHRKPAASAGEKESGIFPAVFVWHDAECADLSGLRGGTGKVIREKCPDCRGTDIFQKESTKDRRDSGRN